MGKGREGKWFSQKASLAYFAYSRMAKNSLDPAVQGLFPTGVEEVVGDLHDHSALDAAFDNVDAVVHMAALLHRMDRSPAWAERCHRVNVAGTERVIDRCLKHNVRRLVLFSTIAV